MLSSENVRKKMGFRSLAELSKNFQDRQKACPVLKELVAQVESIPIDLPEQDEMAAVSQTTCSTTGTLKKVFQSKGFGFLAPSDGSQDVFLHFRDIANGSSRDLVVGTKMHFELTVDECKNRKARNAIVLLTKSCEPATPMALESMADLASQTYSRHFLLGAFGSFLKFDGVLDKNPGVPSAKYMPRTNRKTFYEEDPNLNDEQRVMKLEARLSHESGADKNNVDTFGDSAKSGWSFEEAVEANSKVGRCRFGSGDSTPTDAGDTVSECETVVHIRDGIEYQ